MVHVNKKMIVSKGHDQEGASTKLTINLGVIDLGHIDLLVEDGFYSNRTDFIRSAIRNQAALHRDELKRSIARRKLGLGLMHITRAELEAMRDRGETLQIETLGLVRIAEDVDPELALATIASIRVLGALQATARVKSALSSRIR